ncbi:MAG TPA: hypothetical protein HPP66_02205 [Planctomycetes bacterium]|nr:hypothetical protein [Planctomycetota bacterium]
MNRKQEIVLWAGLIVIQLMIIFPPIGRLQVVSEGVEGAPESSAVTGRAHGYGIIIRDYKNIRFGLLVVQLVIAAAGTVVLIYTLREKETKDYGH